MTFQDLVQFMRTKLAAVDASNFDGHAAYQFNVRGEGEGAFYVEVNDGKIYVEGYEYFDRDVIFECDSAVLVDIAECKISAENAVAEGKLSFDGNIDKALAFSKLIESAKKAAEKPAKKTAAKAEKKQPAKSATKKTAEKPAADKTEAPKAAEKKTDAAKPAAKKSAAKKETK